MGPLCSAALQCLPTYRGEGPASEPEVRATQDYMAEIATRHTVLGALDCKLKLLLSSGTVLLLAPPAATAAAPTTQLQPPVQLPAISLCRKQGSR